MAAIMDKRILDHMNQWMLDDDGRATNYQQTPEEAKCFKTYRTDWLLSGAGILGLFSYIGYTTIDVNQLIGPKRKPGEFLLTLGALSGAALLTTYFTASVASNRCFTCLLKTRGEEQKLGDMLEQLLREYHPNAKRILKSGDRDVSDVPAVPIKQP
ncbi:hypothetical protein RI367_006322 [Sorochytrium milnesiophthora]